MRFRCKGRSGTNCSSIDWDRAGFSCGIGFLTGVELESLETRVLRRHYYGRKRVSFLFILLKERKRKKGATVFFYRASVLGGDCRWCDCRLLYRDSAHYCRIITLLGENLNPSDYCSGKGLRSTEDENLRLFKPFKQTRDLAPTPYAQLYRVQCTAHSETQPILHRLLFLLR